MKENRGVFPYILCGGTEHKKKLIYRYAINE